MRRRLRSRYWEHLGWRRSSERSDRGTSRAMDSQRAQDSCFYSRSSSGMLRMHTVLSRPWRIGRRTYVGRVRTQRAIKTTSMSTQVYHASVLHALAAHILATSLTTQTTGLVAADEQGALLGLEHALFAGARVVGPIMGTSLLAAGGVKTVAVVCAVVDVALALTLRDGSAKEAAEEEKTN